MFCIADKLLHITSEPVFPTHDKPSSLAQDYTTFFTNNGANLGLDPYSEPAASSTFASFCLLTESEVLKLINSSPIKSCLLGLIPADLFKKCLHTLQLALTSIVNLSLQSGFVLSSCCCPTLDYPLSHSLLEPL